MLEAAWWGFVGGASLLVGAVLGLVLTVSHRVIGLVMAFGAGVLISAAAFELTEEAYQSAGGVAAALGLFAGAVTFFAGDVLIDRRGGHRRKSPVHGGVRHPKASAPEAGDAGVVGVVAATNSAPAVDSASPVESTAVVAGASAVGSAPAVDRAPAVAGAPVVGASSGLALVLGALLDGIPESAAIGISLLGGGGVSMAMVAAVFISNVPESLSATTGLKASGRATRWILGLWSLVVASSTVAAVLGCGLLGGASAGTVAFIQTFAAGAILTMLADTMMPEAVEHSGRLVGLLTVMGFAVAFLLGAA